MQQLGFIRMVCLGFLVFAITGSSATLYPFLTPVRTEITNQLAFVSDTNNDVARRTAQIRMLTQARSFLDRRGRVSLPNDIRMLATLSTLLSRNSALRPAFEPVLVTAVQDYNALLIQSADTLGANLAALPPSADVDAALANLGLIYHTLDQVEASAADPGYASRLLNRAAVRLIALEVAVPRLEQDFSPAANSLTAFINGENFESDLPPLATYSPGTGVLTIRGSQNAGTETRSLSITISGVRNGRTTSHQLGTVGAGSYAIYTRTGTNTVGYTSTSGSAIVTLEMAGRTVTGTFSFVGTSRAGLATPLQVSGGSFTATTGR